MFFFLCTWTWRRTQLTMIATTVGRIRRSQTVALTVIVDYVCNVSLSALGPSLKDPALLSVCLSVLIPAVIWTIDNCDCICYNAAAEGAGARGRRKQRQGQDGLTLSQCVVAAAFLLIMDCIKRWTVGNEWECQSNEPANGFQDISGLVAARGCGF